MLSEQRMRPRFIPRGGNPAALRSAAEPALWVNTRVALLAAPGAPVEHCVGFTCGGAHPLVTEPKQAEPLATFGHLARFSSHRRKVTGSGATGPVPQGAAAAAPGEVSGGITDRFPSVAAAEETNCSPHDLHVADVTTMRPSGQATALAMALPLSHDSNGFVPARVRALGVCA
jgi:hypothetical protein